MQQLSNLSYAEYEAWCRSRFPALVDRSESPMSTCPTMVSVDDEPCPVTVRSYESQAVITPRARGSK